MTHKPIEELTDEDLMEVWSVIGGTPHLFEHGKEDLKELLTTGYVEDNALMLDYYTMAAIVYTLQNRGFCNAFNGCNQNHDLTDQ